MDIRNLLGTLSKAASSPDIQTGITPTQRQELYHACEKLSSCLETPLDRLRRSSFDFASPIILRVALDLGIFDLFNKEDEPDREFEVSEIARHTKSDEELICRIMRFLVTLHIVDVTPEGKCKANSFTKSLQPGTGDYAITIMLSGVFIPLLSRLPVYFRQNGNRVPEDSRKGIFQDAFATDVHIYDWFNQNKVEHDGFHQLMVEVPSSTGTMWTQYIPEKWILEKFQCNDARSGKFTIVDMGASSAQVLNGFRQRLPGVPVRMILQDLPDVTKGKHHVTSMCRTEPNGADKIERMDHDFFEPQPVRGASVYILARALHNWPDKESATILRHIQAAMTHQSTLLIYDCVFSDRLEVVSYNDAVSDMIMMAALASLERTEGQFRALLRSVGLKLVNIWRTPFADDKQAILEIVREDQPSE